MIPFVDLQAQYRALKPEIDAAVLKVLDQAAFILGPAVASFERDFAAFCGTTEAIGVNSGTSALHLALLAAGIGPGDEVITVSYTFVATAAAIRYANAQPVYVDVTDDSYTMDASKIEEAITPRTKAVIPVHLAGQPCDMRRVSDVSARHGLTVIEDAAHAIGAEYDNVRVGGHGRIACFSFYATKNITSAEGGALTTSDADLADRVAIMSLHGISRDAWKRYSTAGYRHWDIVYPGYKYNMFDLQAALVLPQLAKIEQFWARRVELKARLDAGLATIPEIRTYHPVGDVKHAHHLYPIVVLTERLRADRDTIMNAIQAENIGVGVHFRAVHLHPYYQERWSFRRGMFPNAEYYSDRTISLPLYPKMSDRDADDVVDVVRKVIEWFRH